MKKSWPTLFDIILKRQKEKGEENMLRVQIELKNLFLKHHQSADQIEFGPQGQVIGAFYKMPNPIDWFKTGSQPAAKDK